MMIRETRKCTICKHNLSEKVATRIKTCGGECAIKHRDVWMHAYFQRSDVKKKRYATRNTPETKIQSKIYHQKHFQLPEVKARIKRYLNLPEVKARNKAYHKKYNAEYYLKIKMNKI